MNQFRTKLGSNKRAQKGATMWTTMAIVLMVGLIVFVSGKLTLAYIDHGIIRGAMQDVVNKQGFSEMTSQQIHTSIQQLMRVNNIRGFGKKEFKVSRDKSGEKFVLIEYSKKVPLFGNISALVEFKEEVRRSRR